MLDFSTVFQYGDRPFAACQPQITVSENANTVTKAFVLPDGFTLTARATAYPGFGAAEWVNEWANNGTFPTQVISDLWDCDVRIPMPHEEPHRSTAYMADPSESTKLFASYGSDCSAREFTDQHDLWKLYREENDLFVGESRDFAPVGGRSCDGTAPFFRIAKGNCQINVAIGWTGQWNARFTREADALRVQVKIEDTHFRILPGEKFRTASVVIQTVEGNADAAVNQWRRLMRKHFSIVGNEGQDAFAPFCMGFWGGMTTEGAIRRLRTADKAGFPMEYAWMDAGWYGMSDQPSPDEFEGDWAQHTGDWRVNPYIHPDGLQDFADEIVKTGRKFLLWFEPERVRENAPVFTEHRDYLLDATEGDIHNHLYNLGNEEAWNALFETLSGLIARLHIRCYRQDFNFEPLPYWRHADTPDRRGITEIKHINGLYRLWDALQARFPGLLIDNCASGGRRIDIEMMRRSIPLWRSDAECPANFPPELAQMQAMNFSAWLPYSGTSVGRLWGDVYRFRSCYAPALTSNYTYAERDDFGNDAEQLAWVVRYANEYCRIRPYFSGDRYLLTKPTMSDDVWQAIQYDRPENGDGMIQVFRRANTPYTDAAFRLGGIVPEKRYTFTDLDDEQTFTRTGAELLRDGLCLHLAEPRTAKIYLYTVS